MKGKKFMLPKEFLEEMKDILKEDYDLYARSTDDEPFRGISVNRLKTDEKIIGALPFEVKKTPFYKDGYYIPCDEKGIGNTPFHSGGAFYVQEPSAMSAVTLLDVCQNDKILDLCAAPGGKSAQIASCLNNTGLIWSNEVVRNRAQILLSNFERMGISKGIVSSCYPEVLCSKLEEYFDKVLVDAPCSGEGMFRKNPEAVLEWSREHTVSCAERQLSILRSAAKAVKSGGILVYSTCTFSYCENEGVIKKFLEENPDFEQCEIDGHFGRKTKLPCAVRITPIEGGEGHFAAKLRRKGENVTDNCFQTAKDKKQDTLVKTALKELENIFYEVPKGEYNIINDKLYIMPENLPDMRGLGVIRAGIFAGEFKKNRFEPSHALFMSAKPENIRRILKADDDKAKKFLSGMELDSGCQNGYTAVVYGNIIIGFGKTADSRLKNKYPKGLRIK